VIEADTPAVTQTHYEMHEERIEGETLVTDGGEEVEAGADQIRSEVDYEDWMDISESELVDYVKGRTSFGLVFDHDEIGLHGIKFDPATGVLEAVAYEVR
jgi:hypothetical protein